MPEPYCCRGPAPERVGGALDPLLDLSGAQLRIGRPDQRRLPGHEGDGEPRAACCSARPAAPARYSSRPLRARPPRLCPAGTPRASLSSAPTPPTSSRAPVADRLAGRRERERLGRCACHHDHVVVERGGERGGDRRGSQVDLRAEGHDRGARAHRHLDGVRRVRGLARSPTYRSSGPAGSWRRGRCRPGVFSTLRWLR